MTRSRILSSARSRIGVAVGLVAFLVLVGSGTAQATWTTLSSAQPATASATTASVLLSDISALNTTYNYTGTTSPLVIAPATLQNTGGAPLTYTLTETNTNATLAAKIAVWIWLQVSGSCGTTTVGTAGTLAAIPALPAGATSGTAGQSTVVCIATQLTGTILASSGSTLTANFTLSGKVGANWQGTDPSSMTQSVFQAADVTNITCSTSGHGSNTTATVSWSLPAGATGASIYVGSTLVLPDTSTVSFTATKANVGSATSITIKANYASGVQSAGVVQALDSANGSGCG
ncbi:MAG: hypothetical protein QOK08_260 [Actinomycetota bacterium]|nr:hypothetical protein [Actinomycetota bacterium]MDQ1572746.1 hypothetical protein [Actinomycetota bacterium]